MTTELMIAYLLKDWTASGSAPHPGDPILKIIAAIRAGKAMYKDLDNNEAGYTAGQAAWDAATSNPLDELAALGQEMAKELGEEY